MQKTLKTLIFSCLLAGGFFVAKTAYAATEFTSIIDPDNGAGTVYSSKLTVIPMNDAFIVMRVPINVIL